MDEGERDAFVKEVGSHRSRIVWVIRRVLQDTQDTEDALQDTILRTWQQLGRVTKHPRLNLLLPRIALNVALNNLSTSGHKYDDV